MNHLNQKFVILGGGITGCSVAWLLKQCGAAATVYEQKENCGGIARTHYLNGHPYEFGPHILHAQRDVTINFYKKYGVREIDYYTKMVFNDDINTLVDFPFSTDTLQQLPAPIAKKIKTELSQLDKTKINNSNIEAYLKSIFGETLYRHFNYGYTKKFWGKEPKDVPSNGAAGWIGFRTKDKRLFSEWQGYPKEDLNAFFKWIMNGIDAKKATISGIGKINGNRIESINTDQGPIRGDYFISTLPPEILFQDIKHKPIYTGKTIVFLQIDKGPVLPNGIGGVYFPNGWDFNRIVEYPAMNNVQYPNLPNGSLLGIEYPLFNDQPEKSPEQYVDDAVYHVKKLYSCNVNHTAIRQHKSIYPVRSKEQIDLFRSLFAERAKTYSNLSLTGRYGRFVYVNMNNCFEMALNVVAEIIGTSVDELTQQVGL